MNRYLVPFLVAASLVAAAGYGQRSEAAPLCGSAATYAALIGLGSCDIGDKTFGDFTYGVVESGGATAVPVTEVTAIAVDGPPFWGFNFGFALAATTGQLNEIFLTYTVTCNALAAVFDCIDSTELAMTSLVAGGGSARVDEFVQFPSHSPTNVGVTAGDPTATASYAGVHTESLFKEISVSCIGTPNCAAAISSVTNTVDQVQVPEPATWTLLGAAIFSIAALRRRRPAQQCYVRRPAAH